MINDLIQLVKTFVEILRTWPVFFQFMYITFACYFFFCLFSDLITRGFHFLSSSLPIILHGWPEGSVIEEVDEDSNIEEPSTETQENKK